MNTLHRPRNAGFTIIELLVVVTLVSVILTLVAPSFYEVLVRNRLEGVASELATDLQYARSEAVARNTQVGLIAGVNCYTVFVVDPTSAASSCTSLGTNGVAIKSVTVDAATISLAFTSNSGQAFIQFDPVRGMATDATGADWSGFVTVGTTAGNWQLRADVTNFGRAKACSPSGTFKGYPSC